MTIKMILQGEFEETYNGVKSFELSGAELYIQGENGETITFPMKDITHFEIIKK